MKYKCSRCEYNSENRTTVKRHIEKTSDCSVVVNDVVKQLVQIEFNILCKHCGKSFHNNSNLGRHQKSSCKVLKANRESVLEAELEKLKKELEEAKSKPQTVVNQYIQNNFIVNGYRKTSFEHLTDHDYKKAVRRMIYSVPQMIQDVHFNKNAPENHNIYISNIKGKYAMVYDGEKWCSKPQAQVIDQLINDQEYAMEDWLGEGDNFPKEMQKFNEYLEKKEKHDEVRDIIKEEVKLLLYNNRNIIKGQIV